MRPRVKAAQDMTSLRDASPYSVVHGEGFLGAIFCGVEGASPSFEFSCRGGETTAWVRTVLVGYHPVLALLVFLLLQCCGHLCDPSNRQTLVLSGCLRACGQGCGEKNENVDLNIDRKL